MKLSKKIKFKNGYPYIVYHNSKRPTERRYGIIKICPVCDEKYFSERNHKNNFCSISCSHKNKYNPMWKGGKYLDTKGYVIIRLPTHPFATKQGLIYEHRLVMEKHLGRYLKPKERIHHKDGNRKNNEISNLFLFKNQSLHMKNCPRENGKYTYESSVTT